MRNETNAQFSNMLRVGQDMGCQIQPSTSDPKILTGLCPFHESLKLHDAKTLHINLETARFWCITCHATGNPMGFVAKVWGVSAQEAYEFIKSGCKISPDRPRWETQLDPRKRAGAPPPQNTAILTMATQYYSEQVELSYPALQYLATLGVNPRQAVQKGLGYCPGSGLREHLERNGAAEEEIEVSPLFQEITGMEYLSNCVVMSDLDWTGATIWMMAIIPEEGTPQTHQLPARRPRTRGLPGRRNRVFNLRSINHNNSAITVTDDPRLYLVLEANGFQAALVTEQRRTNNMRTLTESVGGALGARRPHLLILATHDRELGTRIGQSAKKENSGTIPMTRSMEEILQQLDPKERDLQAFTSNPNSRKARRQREREEGRNRENTVAGERPPETAPPEGEATETAPERGGKSPSEPAPPEGEAEKAAPERGRESAPETAIRQQEDRTPAHQHQPEDPGTPGT